MRTLANSKMLPLSHQSTKRNPIRRLESRKAMILTTNLSSPNKRWTPQTKLLTLIKLQIQIKQQKQVTSLPLSPTTLIQIVKSKTSTSSKTLSIIKSKPLNMNRPSNNSSIFSSYSRTLTLTSSRRRKSRRLSSMSSR